MAKTLLKDGQSNCGESVSISRTILDSEVLIMAEFAASPELGVKNESQPATTSWLSCAMKGLRHRSPRTRDLGYESLRVLKQDYPTLKWATARPLCGVDSGCGATSEFGRLFSENVKNVGKTAQRTEHKKHYRTLLFGRFCPSLLSGFATARRRYVSARCLSC